MLRVCYLKATNKVIEMQSGGDDNPDLMEMRLNTLKQNAINAGYQEADIDVSWMNEAEYNQAELNDPVLQAQIAAQTAKQTARNNDIINNLPSWQQVSDAIDGAVTLAALKVITKKLARVVYWLAKDSES